MLTINLNPEDNKPLYLKIYSGIRQQIESHQLKSHEKLPSKRALSIHLGTSISTIQTAYGHLQAEGYIYTKEKVGYFVNELPIRQYELKKQEEANDYDNQEPLIEKRSNFLQEEKVSKLFPFSTWNRLMRKTLSENHYELLEIVPSMGLFDLRQAIAKHLLAFCGLNVNPNQIFIGAGSEYLYGLLVKILNWPKVIAVEDPGYPKIRQIYEAEGVRVEPLSLDEQGLSIVSLEQSNIDVVHVSPSHNFPSGIFMPISRRLEMLSWLEKSNNRYIIEDDFDSEFCWQNKPISPLYALQPNDHVIYMNTFSKTISPALRISYMVLPISLVKRYEEVFGFYACTVSNIQQYTLAEFINGGYYERHINRMKKHYREVATQVQRVLAPYVLAGKIQIGKNFSGLYVTVRINTKKSETDIRAYAQKENLRLTFFSDFHKLKYEGLPSIILNYAYVEPEELSNIIEKLINIE